MQAIVTEEISGNGEGRDDSVVIDKQKIVLALFSLTTTCLVANMLSLVLA
jgi:hypothetical protein